MKTTGIGSLQDRQVTKEGPTPVSARVSPTERIRAHIDELFAEDRPLPEVLEEVARLGAQLLMQAALEAEVTEFLGRDRYQRAAACDEARDGSRNGYRPVQVKTTAGPVELARPKLRGTTEKFASRLFGAHLTKTHALESLVIASFVRGLSVRDVEATLAEALGDQAAISKSTVSQVCQAIRGEYQAWTARRLDAITLDYLFLDASFFRMHPGSPAEPILAAWGITTDGKPAFIGLAPGTGESFDAWHEFLTDLQDRGLSSPLLVISDGAKGLIAAVEQAFPAALRQRCLIHRLRNVLAKIPTGMQAEIKDAYWAVFDTADMKTPPGPRLVETIDRRIDALANKYRTSYPAAVKILLTDRAGLTAYLRFPTEHHHRIRHSNFIERTFGETRRRAKVIGRFPGETSCISIVWAVLDRASRGWRGFTVTANGLRLLQDLRRSLLEPPTRLQPRTVIGRHDNDVPETVTAAA
jgi:putative transposase